jgi:hypothetical protein
MGVQALHAGARPADAAVWSRASVVWRYLGVALGGVAGMGVGDLRRVDLGLSAPHSAVCLEMTDSENLASADQPVSGGHWLAIIQQGRVAHDDGLARSVSNHDLECSARRPANQCANGSDVVAHVVSRG